MKKILDFAERIPGWMSRPEMAYLMLMCQDADVVEVGCYCGRSTFVIASVCHHVWAVDHHRGSAEHQRGASYYDADFDINGRINTLPRFEQTIHGLTNITPVIATSSSAALTLKEHRFDVAVIDAGHDYNSVSSDLQWWGDLADTMLVHDYGSYPDVTRAVNELKDWQITGGCETLVRLENK